MNKSDTRTLIDTLQTSTDTDGLACRPLRYKFSYSPHTPHTYIKGATRSLRRSWRLTASSGRAWLPRPPPPPTPSQPYDASTGGTGGYQRVPEGASHAATVTGVGTGGRVPPPPPLTRRLSHRSVRNVPFRLNDCRKEFANHGVPKSKHTIYSSATMQRS